LERGLGKGFYLYASKAKTIKILFREKLPEKEVSDKSIFYSNAFSTAFMI